MFKTVFKFFGISGRKYLRNLEEIGSIFYCWFGRYGGYRKDNIE